MRRSKAVVRVGGEVVGPEPPMAHPIPRDERGIITASRAPATIIYVQPAAPVAEVVPVASSRAVPWALIALALAILAFACFASWHTWIGPQIDPTRPHQVDLVGPSR